VVNAAMSRVVSWFSAAVNETFKPGAVGCWRVERKETRRETRDERREARQRGTDIEERGGYKAAGKKTATGSRVRTH
jgi:hypothetical protein